MRNPTAPPRAAFSKKETCQSIGCSLDWLNRKIKDGTVRSVKLGGRVFIPASELSRLLDQGSA